MRGSRKCMPFAIPLIWRESTNHHCDCYFCTMDISKYKKTKDRKKIVYSSTLSCIAPVNHGLEVPIPQPTTTHAIPLTSLEDDDVDFEVDTQCSSEDLHFPNQNELDDLTRDPDLTKARAEILSFCLKEWNLLAPSCKISKPRKRHVILQIFMQCPLILIILHFVIVLIYRACFKRLVLPTQLWIGVYSLTVLSEA